MFAFSPNRHLDEGHKSEESHRHTLGHHCEADPGADLICVVRTRDEPKDPGEGVFCWIRNLLGFGAWCFEVTKRHVDGKIPYLTEQENVKTCIHLLLPVIGCGVERVVNVVCHPSCSRPVIATVLKNVPERHGPMGDTMDKQCLQNPLDVVEGVTYAGQMYDPVLAAGEVILWRVDEGKAEVEH